MVAYDVLITATKPISVAAIGIAIDLFMVKIGNQSRNGIGHQPQSFLTALQCSSHLTVDFTGFAQARIGRFQFRRPPPHTVFELSMMLLYHLL